MWGRMNEEFTVLEGIILSHLQNELLLFYQSTQFTSPIYYHVQWTSPIYYDSIDYSVVPTTRSPEWTSPIYYAPHWNNSQPIGRMNRLPGGNPFSFFLSISIYQYMEGIMLLWSIYYSVVHQYYSKVQMKVSKEEWTYNGNNSITTFLSYIMRMGTIQLLLFYRFNYYFSIVYSENGKNSLQYIILQNALIIHNILWEWDKFTLPGRKNLIRGPIHFRNLHNELGIIFYRLRYSREGIVNVKV
jgi:hypothetical protein